MAKRFKDNKYRHRTRTDWEIIRVPYMLWCVWHKCIGSSDYSTLLLFLPEDRVIVEVVHRDPFWAGIEGDDHVIRGKNIMGMIIAICRCCLQQGTTPKIDTDLLNQAGIFLLGERVLF